MYRLKTDIVIPAGTLLAPAPARVVRSDASGNKAMASGRPAHFVSAIVAHGKDASSEWVMHIDDALGTGAIEEVA